MVCLTHKTPDTLDLPRPQSVVATSKAYMKDPWSEFEAGISFTPYISDRKVTNAAKEFVPSLLVNTENAAVEQGNQTPLYWRAICHLSRPPQRCGPLSESYGVVHQNVETQGIETW